jgi:hypothetical protein
VSRADSVVARAERVVLGGLMSLIAIALERRLKRLRR